MDVWSRVSVVRAVVARLFFSLLTGRYSRKVGIGIGIGGAVLIAVVGYVAGPTVGRIVTTYPLTPPLRFTTGDLTVLWGVHATVITLSLVGLSFAWNSIRNLPTTDIIIREIAYRLRSIETITFLLTANLCIGAGVPLATQNVVTADIGLPVGTLLIASIGVTVHRFWIVFDLLLHNTLDEKVFDFADAALSGRSRATASEYDVYLGHFFDACRTEIEHDRPERLREKLRGVEELLDELLTSDSSLKDDSMFWEYVYGKYDAVYRRSVAQQNPQLEKQVIKSLSGVFWKTQNHSDADLIMRALQCFATLFARGYSLEPQSGSAEFLLNRFENVQNRIFRQFEDASNEESFEKATTLVKGLLETHASLWHTAVEHEAVGALDHLWYMLDDVYQFRRYTYASPQSIRDAENTPDDSVEAWKQDRADTYRETIRHLKFAAYGWGLNLFEEGDVSDYFIEQVFTEYVQRDFGSVDTLTEVYFEMNEATEPLNYWERWNLNRTLEKNYGFASTGMAINTWLLRFYCTALVWLLADQGAIEDLRTQDPGESPLTDYNHVQHRVDKITDQIDSYRDGFVEEPPEPISRILRRTMRALPDFIREGRFIWAGKRTALQQSNQGRYPLTNFLESGPSTDVRCDTLISYFKEVKSILDEQEQDWIRTLPVSNDGATGYKEKVDSQLDSCTLRTAVEEVGGITQAETVDQDANAEFTLNAPVPREVFVDDGVPTFFTSNFSRLIERYRELVLDHLDFEEQELDSATDVPDALAGLVSREAVALIVVEHMDVARILRDDERSDRSLNNSLGSHFTFKNIPILEDVTTESDAVVFFDQEFNYIEKVDEYPIAVDVTPGEDVDEWSVDEPSEGKDIRDYVQVEHSYKARINSSGPNGVIFRITD